MFLRALLHAVVFQGLLCIHGTKKVIAAHSGVEYMVRFPRMTTLLKSPPQSECTMIPLMSHLQLTNCLCRTLARICP